MTPAGFNLSDKLEHMETSTPVGAAKYVSVLFYVLIVQGKLSILIFVCSLFCSYMKGVPVPVVGGIETIYSIWYIKA